MTAARKTPNRLGDETSPYLLQHAYNPVDWYPWGKEALERARTEQKPIFLSIGYSACHWCHVMERECFEEPAIAALMNELYVNIKVDREERPDLDEIYMRAVTALSGSGGWPMSVFLTPEQKPFFGATYLPPVRRYGRPSFPDVLAGLADAWRTQRESVVEQAERLTQVIVQESQADLRGTLDGDVLDRARAQILGSFDPTWGGFGDAPKFPHSGDIRLLLRCAQDGRDSEALHAAELTLDRMARGGIFDQLGGGFHRYSTDERWCIPHFEKMLYDNALLVVAYLEAHLRTGNPEHARVAQECCEWALREMVTTEGGFASAQDADSEGEEGRFFAFTPDELFDVLGRRQGLWAATYFDVTPEGNFEDGKSALFRRLTSPETAAELGVTETELEASMREARAKLLHARSMRVPPATDDKVLASWNGLMLSALCTAHQVLDRPRYLQAAQRAASYVLGGMRKPDGSLLATARSGRAHIDACLDDYVFVTQGLIDLYESDFDPKWLREALALCELVEARFADRERGGYCTTSDAHEALIARTKTVHDGALPSGAGVQALNLLRLSELCDKPALRKKAQDVLEAQAALANRHPRSFAALLLALDFVQRRPREIVISGEGGTDGVNALLRVVRRTFMPQRVVALASHDSDEALLPLLQGRKPQSRDANALAYVCRDFRCDAPVSSPEALAALLRDPR